jgi:hypothetical protein
MSQPVVMQKTMDLSFEGSNPKVVEMFPMNLNQVEPSIKSHVSMEEKNFLLKFDFLTKLGMETRAVNSLSKEDMKKMSFIFEAERKESEDEEELMMPDLELKKTYSNAEGDYSLNFFQKTDSEVRQAYLNKLINMKILKLQPSKKHQEIIVFDWDDTLLCTSYLGRHGLVHLPQEIIEGLKTLDEKVCNVLETASSFGKVFIVTNSEDGWVAYTAMAYLPKTYQIIMDKVEIISARTKYKALYPGDNYRWKAEAFLDIKKEFDEGVNANIVSIGDSRAEIEAAKILGDQFSYALVKTVRFRNNPGLWDLVKQLDLLNERFEQIIVSRTSLTIRLEKTI